MPKEDRSDWVAVAPDASSAPMIGDKIKPAMSAYAFFQRDVSEEVKAEYNASNNGKFQVGEFSKLLRDKWNALDADHRSKYEDLARRDQMRFASESHAADVAAIERRERLQRERDTLLLDDEGGFQRSTRGQRAKKERKRERQEKKKQAKKQRNADDEDFQEEDEESSDSYSGESDSSEDGPKKKKAAPRQMSQKQMEYRDKMRQEKKEKEAIIAERQ